MTIHNGASDQASGPKRVRMSRQRPWRQEHPDAVIVARPGRWGNVFRVVKGPANTWSVADKHDVVVAAGLTKDDARDRAVALYREGIAEGRIVPGDDVWFLADGGELRGRDVACWCPLDQACHGDVLLELAAAASPPAPRTLALDGVLPRLVIQWPICGHCRGPVLLEDGRARCETCQVAWGEISDEQVAEPDESLEDTEVTCAIDAQEPHEDPEYERGGERWVLGPKSPCILPSTHEGDHLHPYTATITPIGAR